MIALKMILKKNAIYVSKTTDSWTLVKNENYIAVTVHLIDEECGFEILFPILFQVFRITNFN